MTIETTAALIASRVDPPPHMTVDERDAYLGLTAAMALAHKTASDAGWYRDPQTGEPIARNFGEVVALMHSELSEALEAHRKSLMDDKLPHRPGIEVAGAVIEKNRFNQARADHKLEARRQAGGKAY